MSPKAVQYKANSIAYFRGDSNERVYILKTGRVVLKYNDIETGQELQDLIQTGEFFGVKSALGKYPREETAVVLQDSAMVTFTVPEFEQVAMANTRIIMKMLRVFSNQLRRIHKQVRNLLSTGEQGNPESGLFNIGQYYLNTKKYSQALYAFRRYLTYYPSGNYAADANDHIQLCEKYARSGPKLSAGQPASIEQAKSAPGSAPAAPSSTASGTQGGGTMSDSAKAFHNAVRVFSQAKYDDAMAEFREIAASEGDQEYGVKAVFEIGRCLFSLEDFEGCIKHYTAMIQKFPKHPELPDALFYVGKCYEQKSDTNKAANFYKKILSMAAPDSSANRKAKKALKKIEAA